MRSPEAHHVADYRRIELKTLDTDTDFDSAFRQLFNDVQVLPARAFCIETKIKLMFGARFFCVPVAGVIRDAGNLFSKFTHAY